ncbi:putative diaminopropionate ammonia-lyase [Mycena kentingensis (nom. inval.)]|nr:putative diaminopropionate ammonia-lyase [Mycena kentingensis (nom. inval.)]
MPPSLKSVLLNSRAEKLIHRSPAATSQALRFHQSLAEYAKTSLHDLPSLAESLGLKRVLLKDESHRLGLPSFKILGASWAVYRAVATALGLNRAQLDQQWPTVAQLAEAASGSGITLVCTTEGNWGRAVARMAKLLSVNCVVFVPGDMHPATRALIVNEGADVVVVQDGDYDDCVVLAQRRAAEAGDKGLLVMDIAWDDYVEVPEWVVQGYATSMHELDEGLRAVGASPTHTIVPCGCGSIAQAVVQHFKSRPTAESTPPTQIIAVEPTAAACLYESLQADASTTVKTGETIMAGLNCGTLSTSAWPILRAGIDASAVISDQQAHAAVEDLRALGIDAGPCGAAGLAALRLVCADAELRASLGLDQNSVVVLWLTEGSREYHIPS